MKNIDSKTIDKLSKRVSNYLKDIKPNTYYWNGKMTWIETIKHRDTISRQIKKYSYGATEISKIMCWGGIRNFRDNGHLPVALMELKNNNLKYKTYSRISSFSKLFSFFKPEKYFILDSRVSLVLNSFFEEIDKPEYFIPFNQRSAQGKKVRKKLLNFRIHESMFDNIGIAYLHYNHLIIDLFKKINIPNNLPKCPEIIEMALFSMYKKL
jgi:hypothetical protein